MMKKVILTIMAAAVMMVGASTIFPPVDKANASVGTVSVQKVAIQDPYDPLTIHLG